MRRSSVLVLLTTLSCILPLYGYKVFVYSPQSSHSHVAFMGHLADTLAKAGHNVTVYLPGFMEGVTSTGVKLARTIVRPRKFDFPFDMNQQMTTMWSKDNESPALMLKMMQLMSTMSTTLCQQHLSDKAMIEELRKEEFDLGFAELFDQCSIAYLEAIGVRNHISVLSMNIVEMFVKPFALDSNPSYVPSSFSRFSDEMNYWERAQNLGIRIMTNLLHHFIMHPKLDAVMRDNLGEDFNCDEKVARSSFLFVNSEDFTELPRPIDHRVVYVGGIGAKLPQKLPEDYQKLMNNSVDGVVFVSFGSVMKGNLMPATMKNTFINVFRKFPKITFIWKYDVEDDVGKDVTNLVKVKWAPQNDLFGHPKLRAFVSHGGMNSMTEATHAGVPVVVIPLFGDQMKNAKMVAKRGLAYVIDKHNVTVDSLNDAITAILSNPSYTKSAKRLAAMIRAKPISAEERVLRYSDFAVKFGYIENLDSAARKLNFAQYYLLDIIIPAIIVFVMCLVATLKLLLVVFRRIRMVVVKVKND